jgi:hypothetical protein
MGRIAVKRSHQEPERTIVYRDNEQQLAAGAHVGGNPGECLVDGWYVLEDVEGGNQVERPGHGELTRPAHLEARTRDHRSRALDRICAGIDPDAVPSRAETLQEEAEGAADVQDTGARRAAGGLRGKSRIEIELACRVLAAVVPVLEVEVRAVEIGRVRSQCPILRRISSSSVLTAVRTTFILLLPPLRS